MADKRNNYRFIIGLAVALLLPLSFYMVAKLMGKDQIHMPRYYVADRVDSTRKGGREVYDTVFHHTADLQAVNQFGDRISLNQDLKDRILVVNFFFTTCPGICPRLTRNIHLLQKAYNRTAMKRNDTIVHFVSITVNPERDSVPALRAYAARYDADFNRWWFLTGDKKALYNYARNELHLATPQGDGGADDFIHSEQLVLLDRDRNIRGYYNGLDTAELQRCANDIGLLYLEKKKGRKDEEE